MQISLAVPSLRLYEPWSAAMAEFDSPDIAGSGLQEEFVADRAGCAAFLQKARVYGDPATELPRGKVHCDYFWITDGADVVGFIAFRRSLTEWLRNYGGHIGYAVKPSRRREGIALAALNLVLEHARSHRYERVLITCDDDNIGSYRTIERAGGVLDATIDGEDPGDARVRQYWITL